MIILQWFTKKKYAWVDHKLDWTSHKKAQFDDILQWNRNQSLNNWKKKSRQKKYKSLKSKITIKIVN